MSRTDHCPICGGRAAGAVKRHQREADAIWRCRHCRSMFANPRPEPAEMEALYRREYYPQSGRATPGSAAQQDAACLHRTILRALAKQHPEAVHPGARVLDYGCGLGYFLTEAKAGGIAATGIELSAEAAEHARTRLGLNVRTGGEDALSELAGADFDLVTCFEVLEHVLEPRRTLKLLAACLGPGGVLAISYPNLRCWRYRLEGGRWFNMANPTHLNFFSLVAMKRLLGEVGLSDARRIVYYGGRPGFGPIRNMLQYLARLANLGSDVRVLAAKPAV